MSRFLDNDIVKLRAPEPEDLDLLFKWENDTDVWKFGSAISPYSKYILTQYISAAQLDIFQSKQLRFMIVLKHELTTIGTIDLYDFDAINSRCGVGIYIDSAYRNKQHGANTLNLLENYVFKFLNINQLYAIIPETNKASIQLFCSAEYSKSGVLHQWIFNEDGYEDAIIVQKLKSKL